ncbi:MAG: 5'/3'-nucleotidase SurE [Bacteroidales bacterium]
MSMYKNNRPLILVSNDDAYFAKGLQCLIACVQKFGDIVVVAPATPMSGKSHSITSDFPLRATLVEDANCLKFYKVDGTPADCVKLALNQLLDRRPDLVVAGINHGDNTSVSVLYSGTMGATMEACLHGIPSVGFSLCEHSHAADFSHAMPHIERIVERLLDKGLPKNVCLNINFPKGKIRGVKVGRQGEGEWVEEFDKRYDPKATEYYWLTGRFESRESRNNSPWGKSSEPDIELIDEGYASIVPVNIDMTDYSMIETMKKNGWELGQG